MERNTRQQLWQHGHFQASCATPTSQIKRRSARGSEAGTNSVGRSDGWLSEDPAAGPFIAAAMLSLVRVSFASRLTIPCCCLRHQQKVLHVLCFVAAISCCMYRQQLVRQRVKQGCMAQSLSDDDLATIPHLHYCTYVWLQSHSGLPHVWHMLVCMCMLQRIPRRHNARHWGCSLAPEPPLTLSDCGGHLTTYQGAACMHTAEGTPCA